MVSWCSSFSTPANADWKEEQSTQPLRRDTTHTSEVHTMNMRYTMWNLSTGFCMFWKNNKSMVVSSVIKLCMFVLRLFPTEFNLTSFCREVGPLSYSRMKVLRLDGNKMSYQHLPPDWMFCLRELESIYLWHRLEKQNTVASLCELSRLRVTHLVIQTEN